jgi:hypothetical protein
MGIREPLQYAVDPLEGFVTLYDGHHRWLIAGELGLDEVPVRRILSIIELQGGY